jgi:metacaspase-1
MPPMTRPTVILLAGLAFLATTAHAQTRRALLVGIARYTEPAGPPQPWTPTALRPIPVQGIFKPFVLRQLEGPVADVYAMRDLLVNTYDFKKPSTNLSERDNDDIQILINENATADRILTLLKTHLIDKAKPGDISVFYFAGHGSRITNSLSEKPGHLDVTIVPADYELGVPAIRDKELARIYRQVPDGVSLTVIQDSCHSGGGARGVTPSLHSRDLPDDPSRTVSDPPDERNGKPLPYPDQQKNPVLILAASQADQLALEMHMGDDVGYRGVFTYALVKTLQSSVTHERVDEIFRKLRANMGMDKQEPVVSGQGRLDKDLFGQQAIPASSIYAIVQSRKGELVELDGGIANGMRAGCILKKDWAESGHAAVRIRVKQTTGLNASTAEVIGDAGPDDIRKSDKFLVEAFAASPGPPFVVYMPAKSFAAADLSQMVSAVRDELVNAGAVWVDNPAQQPPTHTLVWNGTSWLLYSADSLFAPVDLGATLVSGSVLANVANPKQARFFLQAPPPSELLARLVIGKGETAAIQVTNTSQADATYALAGALRGKELAYFWLRTEKTGEQFPPLSTQIPVSDLAIVDTLTEDIRTLDRVAGWLTLSAAGDISPPFPYRLVLKKVGGDSKVAEKQVVEGEEYKLYLKGDRRQLDALLKLNESPPKRYVYVGITDSAGHGQLLFPEPGAGNQGNRFPVVEEGKGVRSLPEEIPLPGSIRIEPPLGIDHYYLLVSATPLSNPEVLAFEGAYRDAGSRGVEDSDPLTKLLQGIGDTRSVKVVQNPTTWSIDHMLISSVAK